MKKIIEKYKNLPVHLKASFWFLIAAFLQKGISAISTPVFTRLLNTEQYGQFNVFNSWLSIVTVFVSLKLYAGFYIRGLVKYEDNRNVFTSSMLGLTTVLTIAWTIVYLPFNQFWNDLLKLTTVQVLAMLAMIWTTSAFQFWAMEKRVDLNYMRLIVMTAIVSVAEPVLGVICVIFSEDKVTARILSILFVEVIAYSGCFIAQMRRGKRFFNAQYWKGALVFSIPLIPHYLSTSVLSGADKIMIERMVGLSEAGIYGLAYTISHMMTLFTTALNQTIDPWLYKQIKANKLQSMARIAYISFAFIGVLSMFIIGAAPEIIAIFAPSDYYEAVWVVPPVVMSVYFMFMYNFFAPFEFYYKRTTFIAIATCVGAALNIGLNLIFIRKFGFVAAGYTTLACYIIYALFHFVFMNLICRKEHNGQYPYSARVLLLMSLVFLVLGFAFTLTYHYTIIRYSIIVVALFIAFLFRRKIVELGKTIFSTRKQENKNC